MKTILWLSLAGFLQAAGIEGTIWYDSKGEVAWVEGPASKSKAREPFVPHWVREEQARHRRAYRHGRDEVYVTGFYPGFRWRACRPVVHGRYPRPSAAFRCVRPLASGVRVIIR